MGRPKGKPFHDGKPTPEQIRQKMESNRTEDTQLIVPRDEFVSAAISGLLSRPLGVNPVLGFTREQMDIMINRAYQVAEALESEHRRRYEL